MTRSKVRSNSSYKPSLEFEQERFRRNLKDFSKFLDGDDEESRIVQTSTATCAPTSVNCLHSADTKQRQQQQESFSPWRSMVETFRCATRCEMPLLERAFVRLSPSSLATTASTSSKRNNGTTIDQSDPYCWNDASPATRARIRQEFLAAMHEERDSIQQGLARLLAPERNSVFVVVIEENGKHCRVSAS